MHSALSISAADPRPMYLQIMEQIRQRIALGDWPAGHELPSIRALAVDTQVSVITVKRAYLELEREGLILTRHGRGSFVSDNVELATSRQQDQLAEHLAAAAELARQLGLSSTELEKRLRAALRGGERSQS